LNGKRIAAVILMIASIVLALLLVVGIAGVWVGRGEVTHAVTALSQGVDQGLTITLDRLSRLDGQLVQAGTRTQELQQNAARVGDNAAENQLVLTAIQQTVGDQLAPIIERIQESVSAVADLVRSVNQSVQALNALPFVSIEVPGAEQLGKLSARSDELNAAAQDLRTQVQQTSAALTQKTIEAVTRSAQQLSTVLGDAHTAVTELTARLTGVQGLVPLAVNRVRSWINIAVWVLTVLMLLLGLGQVSLFLHGYSLYTGRDPLARWRNGKNES
jgi:uncharacterized phage infection (PIP) family protein YhgE